MEIHLHPIVSHPEKERQLCKQRLTSQSAVLGAIEFVSLFFVLPPEEAVDKDGKIDWVGSALGLSGLALFNFAWK